MAQNSTVDQFLSQSKISERSKVIKKSRAKRNKLTKPKNTSKQISDKCDAYHMPGTFTIGNKRSKRLAQRPKVQLQFADELSVSPDQQLSKVAVHDPDMYIQTAVESDTSEIIASCLCKGAVLSRDCVMCDGVNCQETERWFHAKCVGLSKEEYQILSLSNDAKWFCADCKQQTAAPRTKAHQPKLVE